MFVLGVVLFSLSLLGRLSGRAALNPTVRVFLYASFALFLPLMSYMFSQAKDEATNKQLQQGAAADRPPLRTVHQQQTLWDAIDQVVRIGWIDYLIYLVATVEVAKRSFAVGKNTHLVVGYTAQMLEDEDLRDEREEGAVLLRKCWYAVMGEDRLKRKVGLDGYRVEVELPESDEEIKKDLVTVGDIWELAEGSDGKPADRLLTDHPKLKDLCLAFALFKLLRVRRREDHTERAFHVVELELNFVMDYYHSVVPVVLCSPWFLVGNYLFVFLIMVNQAIMVLFITGNGRLLQIIGCLARDVVTLSRRAIDLLRCLGHKLLRTVIIAFSSFNILVSLMLFLTFILMEAWEFVVYVLSDWFLVSMLCEYARRPTWQSLRCVSKSFRALLWAKWVGRPRAGMRFNQVCVLDLRRHTPWVVISKVLRHRFLGAPSVRVPAEVKRAVFASLAAKATGGEPLSNGVAELLWACESRSVTHVILVWHIATSIFEMKNAAGAAGTTRSAEETVATTLSRYCAYLVACAPELLPENQEGSERVYKCVKRALRSALSRKRWRSKSETRFDQVMRIEGPDPDVAANMGAELGKQLLEDCGFDGGNVGHGWALLAELWTELVIYIAPSEKIDGHAEALAQGGEFITLLWALATHAGITR
uniref:DUF4220 domain-containing protein n=1 Tax=Setaria viridis TaxID=4556 RepID=A0A4U6UV92_SETVI|nr:hypothetical protein SEVIR_4G086000v2 [Setaria viridis]